MSSMREIKKRITNIKSVEQLIHAMHMVSSTQLRRVNKQLEGVIPVQKALEEKIEEISHLEEIRDFPCYEKREVKKTLYLVLTGDQGLAGTYNNKLQKFTLSEIEGKDEDLIVVGVNGYKFFKKNKKHIVKAHLDISDSKIYYGSQDIAEYILDYFLSGKADEVYIIFTKFENILFSNPVSKKLLPLELNEPKPSIKTYEPDLRTYVDELVPFYLHMCIFRAFSEGHTSEHASRMISMDTASENSKELIEELQREMNRQRQQEITQELAEITGKK